MYAVKMFSTSDVYGVGDDGHVYYWDGNNATTHDFNSVQQYGTGTTYPNQQKLYALWGVSANDFWFGGQGGQIYHFDVSGASSNWTTNPPTASTLPGGGSVDIMGLWGSGASDVYAVTASWGDVYQWGGSSWSSISGANGLPASPNDLNCVWGTGASDVYIVGNGGFIYQYGGATAGWSDISSSLSGVGSVDLTDVFGDSTSGEVFVVGDDMHMWCYINSTWYAIRANGSNADFMGGAASGSFILMAGTSGLTLRLEK
jgi:hypothetical protein